MTDEEIPPSTRATVIMPCKVCQMTGMKPRQVVYHMATLNGGICQFHWDQYLKQVDKRHRENQSE